jgi:hypothetical protein
MRSETQMGVQVKTLLHLPSTVSEYMQFVVLSGEEAEYYNPSCSKSLIDSKRFSDQ